MKNTVPDITRGVEHVGSADETQKYHAQVEVAVKQAELGLYHKTSRKDLDI